MVKVKICGITNLEDALAAARAGCDALGFVFYRKSPRYIPPARAAGIIRRLPAGIARVGVFVNSREKTIRSVEKQCGLTMLQLHGCESPEFCGRFSGKKVIKAFRIKGNEGANAARISRYATFGCLFDSFSPSFFGGTGKRFAWSGDPCAAAGRKACFLSGGLTPANVRQAVKKLRPQWVDVSSGVEEAPGKKDHAKMREFIRAAKSG